ncbi:MAG: zf-HC2 domain-containing protein [Gemmatimonadetes bacterium]|nr:zf-HC2 domain-containing protein [Gemmatimonadota bacterium]
MNPGKADRSREVDCDEYLASHSDYLDGLLSPVAAARVSAHAVVCGSCARYDRIVRKSIELVRDLPDVEPAESFEQRLQHRIFHLEDARALRPRASGAATALGVAAAIALLAWSPLLIVSGERDRATASVQDAGIAYNGYGSVPLFSPGASWYPVAMPAAQAHRSSVLLASFPGPYSPLVVTPPAHRSVRTVSTGYGSID